ncbi:MAG: phosphoribosylanthranilate isomerase [Rhodospirillaceae bacterium]|nr:phosphoribosylanthranilate isomerase [Rhodospirillaceae bacterium]
MTIAVKICGLTDAKALETAVEAGADFVGFVFFRSSPRFVSIEKAAELASGVPRHVKKVGLFVEPSDAQLDKTMQAVRLDMLQLHGRESPERVGAIRKAFETPVMKALGIANRGDVQASAAYAGVADWFLFDTKPPPTATRPGGNAVAFDWTLMKSYAGSLPWMLAGGLTAKNVKAAVKASGAQAVDISSGVETRPGVKSAAKIRAFINAVRAIST